MKSFGIYNVIRGHCLNSWSLVLNEDEYEKLYKMYEQAIMWGWIGETRYLNSRNKRKRIIASMHEPRGKEHGTSQFNLDGEWKRKANTIATFAEKLMYHVIEHLDEEQR